MPSSEPPPPPTDPSTGMVPEAPSLTRPPGAPRQHAVHMLWRVIRYALPHRGVLALSMGLMFFQALAANSRLLMLYPIVTRVFPVAESPSDATAEEKENRNLVANAVGKIKRQGEGFLQPLDDLVSWVNGWTGGAVREKWLPEGKPGDDPVRVATARALERDRYATILTVGVVFLVLTLVMTVCAFFEAWMNEVVRLRILMDVRRDLCAKLLQQPMSFYDSAHRGDVVQRVLDDVYAFSLGLKLVFDTLIHGIFELTAGIFFLYVISPKLTLICLPGMLLFIPLRKFSKKVRTQARKRQSGSAKRVEVLLQIVSGIRTVKAFRSEEAKVAEFHAADMEVYRRSLRVQRTKSLSDAASEFLNNVLVLGLYVGGSLLVMRRVLDITPITLLMFMIYVGNLYKPVKKLVRDLNGMNDAMASIERVFDIVDLPPPAPDPQGAVPFTGVRDAVRFEKVGFAYRQGIPVLEGVSFEIPRGTTVALVGPSGAGKSTICDLLLRFYEPTSGRITVDGKPLPEFARASYLDKAAVVTQEPFLFHTSIGENIRQGRKGATPDDVVAAAKAAFIHDHIASLPLAYRSEVGERGARLSGGQRQRITIARAVVRDPVLLVLDEATSSLDAESERAVQQALDRLREGRTTLVVAHRLATVMRADRIVVLENGRVIDQGTHEELIARGGLYARLCAMQNLGDGTASARTPSSVLADVEARGLPPEDGA